MSLAISALKVDKTKNGAPMRDLHHRVMRIFPAEKLLERDEQRSVQGIVGLGGTYEVLRFITTIDPAAATRCMAIDADKKVLSDLPSHPYVLHLGAQGVLADVIANKHHYPFLATLPDFVKPWETERGLGLTRLGGSILFGWHLDRLKTIVRRFLDGLLESFVEPGPKEVMLHYLFSLGGGTGSSLGFPVAALMLAELRALCHSVQATVIAHCIGPQVYTGLQNEPRVRARCLANAAMTLRELILIQDPEKSVGLTDPMGVARLRRPVFDEVFYYDVTHSGEGLQGLHAIWQAIAANVVGNKSNSLLACQGAREVNPAAAQRGCRADENGSAIFASVKTFIARAPLEKLSELRRLIAEAELLEAAGTPADASTVKRLFTAALAAFELDQLGSKIYRSLQPDPAYDLPCLRKLPRSEAAEEARKALKRYLDRGRLDLERKTSLQGQGLPTRARQRAQRAFDELVQRARSLPDIVAVLGEVVHALERKDERVERELANIADADLEGRLEEAIDQLQEGHFFRRRHADNAQRAFRHLLEVDARRNALLLLQQKILQPVWALSTGLLQTAQRVQTQLGERHELLLDAAIPELQSAIAVHSTTVTEVLAADELPALLQKLVLQVPTRAVVPDGLALNRLIEAASDSEVLEIVATTSGLVGERTLYVLRKTRDLQGFIDEYGLSFKLSSWMAASVSVTLPSNFNLSNLGPGCAPTNGYIAAPNSLRGFCLAAVANNGAQIPFEIVADNDPFRLIVRAKVARVPVSSIGTLPTMERVYRKTRVPNPSSEWEILGTLHLEAAQGIELLARWAIDDGPGQAVRSSSTGENQSTNNSADTPDSCTADPGVLP